MTMRVSPWNWVKAIALYLGMWLKGIPLMLLPAWALWLLGTDDDKECAAIDRDLQTLKRLLKHEG
jgi:hypothetical protein